MDQESLHKKEIREEFWDRGHQRQNASSFDKKTKIPTGRKEHSLRGNLLKYQR